MTSTSHPGGGKHCETSLKLAGEIVCFFVGDLLVEMDLVIEDAASSAVRRLGYKCLKDEQMKIVMEFVKGDYTLSSDIKLLLLASLLVSFPLLFF